jgi:hypothetical protein
VFTARYEMGAYIRDVYIVGVDSVYCAVRTGCLYKRCLYSRSRQCLLRGTDWVLLSEMFI